MDSTGKGRKERSVPFSAKTAQALLEYAQARSKGPVKSGQLFLGKDRQARLPQQGPQAHPAAGIEGVRLSPHTLRHIFAMLYIRNGGDSFRLQGRRQNSEKFDRAAGGKKLRRLKPG